MVEQNTGYNRERHNENLINRNGREQNRNGSIIVQAQVHNNASNTEAPFNRPKTPTSALHSNNTKEQVDEIVENIKYLKLESLSKIKQIILNDTDQTDNEFY
ncbi:unnamed protein product [Acanthoscelides obtectus]|uniref:Uncharacterized protein n=1 Tax=Acanthoscelides obtectus TaxID=200917 RepID=A0A9P0K7Z5_ACAOB|nr:unnamed protein product [Acanthoscelides obtectus]CAK1648023.1 hypothetical protein AOBTE_LOCUS15507 [Acanthoscelides obtectus]